MGCNYRSHVLVLVFQLSVCLVSGFGSWLPSEVSIWVFADLGVSTVMRRVFLSKVNCSNAFVKYDPCAGGAGLVLLPVIWT